VKRTPEFITELAENQVFVFGSNLAGKHNGGGARIAFEKFGAIYGQGIGFQGQSYAIPTLGFNFEKLHLDQIASYVKQFLYYAFINTKKEFLVTEIGCGIAGYNHEQIAPLFLQFLPLNSLPNIILPKRFFCSCENNACV
jgi:hypothetical protein